MMNFVVGFLCGAAFVIGVIFFLKWFFISIHKTDYI